MGVESVQALVLQVEAGERRALARAVTLIESTRTDHRKEADVLLSELSAKAGKSVRLGISGVPGVGKSTFIESFGNYVVQQGRKLAVLSVDPSSALSGGSIMGDKTRMETLSRNPNVFIRPSPAGKTLGGVARRTREAILLCEAAGFDLILVETVGVGQSEVQVASMTDMFVLLLMPNGGDDLQGIKRGIMELADLILINKADGDLQAAAKRTAAEYQHALHLLQQRTPGWSVPVETCSALEGLGVKNVWGKITAFCELRQAQGSFDIQRTQQLREWLWSETSESLLDALRSEPNLKDLLPIVEQEVMQTRMPVSVAVRKLIAAFLQTSNK